MEKPPFKGNLVCWSVPSPDPWGRSPDVIPRVAGNEIIGFRLTALW